MTTVLLIEHQPRLQAALSACLGDCGCRVICKSDAQGAISALEQDDSILVVVADIDSQEAGEGLPFLRSVHDRWPALGLVITSGRLRCLRPDEVPGDGCFVPLPIPAQMLVDLVQTAGHQRAKLDDELFPPQGASKTSVVQSLAKRSSSCQAKERSIKAVVELTSC